MMIRSKSKAKVNLPAINIPPPHSNKENEVPSLSSSTKNSARGVRSKFNSQNILRYSRKGKNNIHQNHRFQKKTFTHPTWCQYANKFIWGLDKSGYECRECGLVVSRRFISEAKNTVCGDSVEGLKDVSLPGWKQQLGQAYRSSVFTIYLPHGAKKSVILNPTEKLRTVLQKVCIERGINIAEFVAEDTHGAVVDLDTTLGLVPDSEITFTKREINANNDESLISPRERKIYLPDFKKIAIRNKSSGPSERINNNNSQSKSPRPGVIESYEIGRELGSGAFSVVKEATHKITQEIVAIKILDKYDDDDDEQTQKFRQEIKIISSLSHENIVQFHKLDEDEENFYVIMELVGGGELFDFIINNGVIKELDAVCVIAQVCKAVEYLHSVGVIHRDLKPENLLFKDSDHKLIKIADFGESRSFKEGQLTTYCGTPDYMAPEIIRGEPYGPEVDIWAIGVISYVMLAGFPPFDGENDIEVFTSILSVRYDFPAAEWNKISTQAKNFIQSILLENPKLRLTASGCLSHPWLTENVPLEQRSNQVVKPAATTTENNHTQIKLVRIKSENNIVGVAATRLNSFPSLDMKRPKAQLKEIIEDMCKNEANAIFLSELKVMMNVLDTTGGKLPLNDFEKVIYQTYHKRLQEIQNHNKPFKKPKK